MQKFNQLFLAFLTIAIFITCTSTAKQRPEGGWLWKISGNGLSLSPANWLQALKAWWSSGILSVY